MAYEKNRRRPPVEDDEIADAVFNIVMERAEAEEE